MQEVINKYETMVVLNAGLDDEKIKALTEKFKTLISKHGELVSVNVWGKRRFAYPINFQNEGYYLLIKFDSGTDFPKELDRVYRITEGVVRSLIVRRDEVEQVAVATVPEATAPEAVVPEATAPEAVVPEAVVSEATAPEAIASEAVVSEATEPEVAVKPKAKKAVPKKSTPGAGSKTVEGGAEPPVVEPLVPIIEEIAPELPEAVTDVEVAKEVEVVAEAEEEAETDA